MIGVNSFKMYWSRSDSQKPGKPHCQRREVVSDLVRMGCSTEETASKGSY